MSMIDRYAVYESLSELGSIHEQRRLWLSTGANNSEVSSFSEAVERLFTDTGLGNALDAGVSGYPDFIVTRLKELEALLKSVDYHKGPLRTIEDRSMSLVRKLATEILRTMPRSPGT